MAPESRWVHVVIAPVFHELASACSEFAHLYCSSLHPHCSRLPFDDVQKGVEVDEQMIWRVERRTILAVPRVDRLVVSTLVARKNNATAATKAEGGTETEGVGLSHRIPRRKVVAGNPRTENR